MVWRFLDFQRHNAFENMAIDEAVFRETIKNKKSPTIRFYGWRPAAVSIGYFQDIEKEINVEKCRADGVDVVRRLSGGKAVFHCREVTYSVVACNKEKLFPQDIHGTYKIISNCIARGLITLGIEASLAETGRKLHDADFKACCFSVPSGNELLVSGRKICGSAQMRTGSGFLQHGSILMDFDPVKTASFLLPARTAEQLRKLKDSVAAINEEITRPVDEKEICANLKKGFASVLGKEIIEGALTSAEEILVGKLTQKYADLRWNSERKKELVQLHD
ncbi:MAG: Octanoyltransferase LipM [Smithella sp. PtaU1.Bin162]|nr:MAG: Octanoyltransferase LipM [Smithella sp. PtaU1.Bin162]